MPSQESQPAAFVSVLVRRAREAVSDGNYARAELLFRSADASEMSVTSAIELGDILLGWGRHDDAREAFEDAWERAKRSGDRVEMKRACLALVRYHRDCGDTLAARQYEQLAIRYSLDEDESVDDEVLLSLATGALGDDDSDLATRYAEAAIAIEPTNGDADAVAGVAMLMGGDAESAGERLYRAYRKHKRSKNHDAEATDMYFVGVALRSLGRYGDASTCHAAAAQTWERTGQVGASVDANRRAIECRQVATAVATPVGVN